MTDVLLRRRKFRQTQKRTWAGLEQCTYKTKSTKDPLEPPEARSKAKNRSSLSLQNGTYPVDILMSDFERKKEHRLDGLWSHHNLISISPSNWDFVALMNMCPVCFSSHLG